MRARAIFIDRDGVINRNRDDYVKHWGEFVFLPGVFSALRLLSLSDFWVVVVTNQAAVGRGLISRGSLDAMHARMLNEIRRNGGRVDIVLSCPHRADEGCGCRKPRPGMLHEAERLFDLELEASYLIGDSDSDVQAALSAGVRPWLVNSGLGAAAERRLRSVGIEGYARAVDLLGAAEAILAQEGVEDRCTVANACG